MATSWKGYTTEKGVDIHIRGDFEPFQIHVPLAVIGDLAVNGVAPKQAQVECLCRTYVMKALKDRGLAADQQTRPGVSKYELRRRQKKGM